MKHIKITSVLLSVAMCVSMVMAPVSVIADETEAPAETQTEVTEKEKPETKETQAHEEPEKEPEKKEAEQAGETEPAQPSEEAKEDKEAAEPEDKEAEETVKEAEQAETGRKEDRHAVPPKNEQVPATEISSVQITLDAPAIGAKPDYSAEFPLNASYYSEAFSNEYYENNIRWLDVTNNTFMYKDSAKFEGKHEYQVVLFLTAKEGYSFSNSTTAKVNGNSAIISIDEAGHLRVSYNFPKLQLVNLASVEVKIDVPVAGSKPDYDLDFPPGALYYSENKNNQIYRNDIRWQDKTDNNKILDPDSAVFETGHEYDVYIYLTAKAGYKFSENTKCTLNGNEATLNFLNGDGDTLGIVYTFKTVLTEISSVSVTLNAPVAGAKPEYTAVLPSGANCYVETQATGTYVRNGIKWRDMSTSTDLDPDSDEFAVGHLYEVSFYLSAKDDYTISNNITVQINGQTATARFYFGNLLVSYTFPALTSVNTLSVTPKTAKVKYKKLKKKKQTVARSKVMNVQYAQGKVTYKLTGVKRGKSKKYKKYFKINSTTGNVTIKKKLKKGTYKVTCVVTAAGDSNYKAGTKTVTFTIKVK